MRSKTKSRRQRRTGTKNIDHDVITKSVGDPGVTDVARITLQLLLLLRRPVVISR